MQKIEQKIHSIENGTAHLYHSYCKPVRKTEQFVSYKPGEAILRALADQDQSLPKALYRILDSPLIRYHCPNLKFDGQSFLSHVNQDQKKVVSMAIESHTQKLVNAVLLGTTYWILLTHFDVYLQNMSGTDDCAIPSKWQYSAHPIIKILRKTEFGKEWKEIIVQWGRIQVLAVGGFFGQVGSYQKTAFLGSAIPAEADIADDNFRILVPFCQQPYLRTTRYLRNFCKYSATLEWSFCSEQFLFNNFSPCHPTQYDNHYTRAGCAPSTASIISIILRCIVNRHVTKCEIERTMEVLAKVPEMVSAMRESGAIANDLQSANAILLQHKSNSSLLRPLKTLVEMEKLLGDKEDVSLTYFASVFEDEILGMYKNIMYRHVKRCNDLGRMRILQEY
ncbi:unnamed protein product [Umbelopsis ramanniana]